MAIKVKHEGSAASRIAASAQGGAAKRAMEAAALAKPSQIQTLQAAHASAPGISTPHAQLISAPGGTPSTQLISPPSGGGGGGGRGGGGRGMSSASTPSTSGDYKVTGTSPTTRPDDESVWNDGTRQWIRPWKPGEKEAEALRRTGEVQNDLADQRELTAQGRRERAALVGDVVTAIKQGRFSKDEIPSLMQEFGIAEDTIRMADSLRDREPTAAESFAKNTYTDQNGIVFSRDGKMLYNPNDAKIKQAEFAAKQLDALKARADKYELELRKPYKKSFVEDGEVKDQFVMREEEEIQRLLQQKYPDLYPSVPPPPVTVQQPTGGSPIVVSPFDPMNLQNPLLYSQNGAQQTASTAPVAGDPASFDQFKKRKQ